MLSWSSSQNSSMTSRLSISMRRKIRPNSLAKDHLGGMKGIAGVLERLGRTDVDDAHGPLDEVEQALQHVDHRGVLRRR